MTTFGDPPLRLPALSPTVLGGSPAAHAPPAADTNSRVSDLWDRVAGSLRGWLARRAPRHADADDLLQDTWLRVLGGVHGVRDDERIEAWVRRVAARVLADAWRGRQPVAPGLVDEPPEDRDADDEQRAELRRRVGRWLERALDGLPEPERTLMQLSEVERLPQAQIAARLGLTVPAVKARVRRGRAHLRDAAQRCCRLEFDRRGALIDTECVNPACACEDDGDCAV